MLGHFLAHFAERHRVETPRLSEGAAAQLVAAEWPGNVRQLRNVAERLVVRARAGLIAPKDLPREILSMTGATSPAAAGVPPAPR
jgi:two-component system NtrC family response regulator